MIPEIFPILSGSIAVTTIFGTTPVRIFPWGEAPERVTYPYATYGVFNGNPENYLNQVPDVDMLGTQIDIWAKTGASCINGAIAIRNALEPTSHMVSISSMTRDPETKSYNIRLDFDCFTFR